MPGQSGASEIKPGNNWINRGSGCDHAPQAMKATAEHAKRVAMKAMSLTVAMLLGFGATALVAAEQPATGPSGFSAPTESANSKGKTGEVLKVMPKEMRAIVQGVNTVKRHTKPNQKVKQGGILEREAPFAISNVMYLCPVTQKPTRLGVRTLDNGRRVRVSKKSNDSVE